MQSNILLKCRQEQKLAKLNHRCEVLSDLLDKKITQADAAIDLNVTVKQIKRLKKKFKEFGPLSLIHGSTGVRDDGTKFSGEVANTIIGYYSGRFAEEQSNRELDFSEYNYMYLYDQFMDGDLCHIEINMSYSTFKNGLNKYGFISPRAKKKPEQDNISGGNRNIDYLPGERIEIDASEFDWFGDGEKHHIHIIYCRGLYAPVGLYMEKEETTKSYFHAAAYMLTTVGFPKYYRSDQRGTFVNLKKKLTSEKFLTQFNKPFIEQGVEMDFTSNPNGKPLAESYGDYLQKNLPAVFRRLGITTPEQANEYFANTYIPQQKARGARKNNVSTQSLYGKKLNEIEIAHTLKLEEKSPIVQKGGFINFKGQYVGFDGNQYVQFPKGTKVNAYVNYLGQKFCKYLNSVFELKLSSEASSSFGGCKIVTNHLVNVGNDYCVKIDGNRYVLVGNNDKALRLDERVVIQDDNGELTGFTSKGACKLVLRDDYKYCGTLYKPFDAIQLPRYIYKFNNDEYFLLHPEHDALAIFDEERKCVLVQFDDYGPYHEYDGIKLRFVSTKSKIKKEPVPLSTFSAQLLKKRRPELVLQ